MKRIAIVVPTIRPESLKEFKSAWQSLFDKHNVELIVIHDGDDPLLEWEGMSYGVDNIMGNDKSLIYNRNDGVRNLGFAFVLKRLPDVEYIITLDDDVRPLGDTIEDHLKALNSYVPISWLSTASEYMRGFPYGIRSEAEVVLSHGVWQGVKDWDAPTQLTLGNRDVTFYKGAIPKGIYYPMCIMNVAFKRKMIPYIYQAPMGYRVGYDRFADIWSGIVSKRVIDSKGWAVVTGLSSVLHERASNVFTNLIKEAKGLELNETFWQGDESSPYFDIYKKDRERWEQWCNENTVDRE